MLTRILHNSIRLNRSRSPEQRLHFVSKTHLARRILSDLQPLLPNDFTVYVLFGSWYAAARSFKFNQRQGWHAICALKSNRKLDGQRLNQREVAQRHQRYIPVVLTADCPSLVRFADTGCQRPF